MDKGLKKTLASTRQQSGSTSSGTWITRGFEAFREGTFGNAGENLYTSKAGVLQRIHLFDLNRDGYDNFVLGMHKSGDAGFLNGFVYFGSAEGLTERFILRLATSRTSARTCRTRTGIQTSCIPERAPLT